MRPILWQQPIHSKVWGVGEGGRGQGGGGGGGVGGGGAQ